MKILYKKKIFIIELDFMILNIYKVATEIEFISFNILVLETLNKRQKSSLKTLIILHFKCVKTNNFMH